MITSHILGFPRIGSWREMKKAVEAYWRKEITLTELENTGKKIQQDNWQMQKDAGLSFVTVGDFSWYDHVLDTSMMLGTIPQRFQRENNKIDINTLFCMARGMAPEMESTTACEMTKWFNTNYHYIVPELVHDQKFKLTDRKLFDAIDLASSSGHKIKPVILGPLTYLWLGKAKDGEFDKLTLAAELVKTYNEIFAEMKQKNVEWMQIDEPILVLDLPENWRKAFKEIYQQLNFNKINCLLATYFDQIHENLKLALELPVQGIHCDFATKLENAAEVAAQFPQNKILSAGVINGRNIWKADLTKINHALQTPKHLLGDRLWIASSCSLMHVPVDLANEDKLDTEIKNWLSYAKQKLSEVSLSANILENKEKYAADLAANQQDIRNRQSSSKIHNAVIQQKMAAVNHDFAKRKNNYTARSEIQKQSLNLPLFPTTTIGSFPQTQTIRVLRQDFKSGKIDENIYKQKIKAEIAAVIKKQEDLDIDVLVHGEPERNDMVEYFGELLNGFAFTANGWVQSYGSRCVKPPIIYGDISRDAAMTVQWTQYAQSLTPRPVKGMLTGPVTILAWSFVRDDQPYSKTALQIALALRDEVIDLEKAGIKVIQIDEPAFREALPLRRADWEDYFNWAAYCFRIAASGVADQTQIHTHMCYSEFNEIIDAIASLDADVITLESSRSHMELLEAFENFAYPNEIGPGVYDIHSPRIPTTKEINQQLANALRYVPAERLWVNPDCGLKTRNWPEVEQALANMVEAANQWRVKIQEEGANVST